MTAQATEATENKCYIKQRNLNSRNVCLKINFQKKNNKINTPFIFKPAGYPGTSESPEIIQSNSFFNKKCSSISNGQNRTGTSAINLRNALKQVIHSLEKSY